MERNMLLTLALAAVALLWLDILSCSARRNATYDEDSYVANDDGDISLADDDAPTTSTVAPMTLLPHCQDDTCHKYCERNLTKAGLHNWFCENVHRCICNPWPECSTKVCFESCQRHRPGSKVVDTKCTGPRSCICNYEDSTTPHDIPTHTTKPATHATKPAGTPTHTQLPGCNNKTCHVFCENKVGKGNLKNWTCEKDECRCNVPAACEDEKCHKFCAKKVGRSNLKNWACVSDECHCNLWPDCDVEWCQDECMEKRKHVMLVSAKCNGSKSCECDYDGPDKNRQGPQAEKEIPGCDHISCSNFCLKKFGRKDVDNWVCEADVCRCNPWTNCTWARCAFHCKDINPAEPNTDAWCDGPESCFCRYIKKCTPATCAKACKGDLNTQFKSSKCEGRTCVCEGVGLKPYGLPLQ